jgi:hypothetical protein
MTESRVEVPNLGDQCSSAIGARQDSEYALTLRIKPDANALTFSMRLFDQRLAENRG